MIIIPTEQRHCASPRHGSPNIAQTFQCKWSPLVTSTQRLACSDMFVVLSIWRKPWLRKSPKATSLVL